jgi:hypothetical protein
MKKIFLSIVLAIFAIGLMTTPAYADYAKGQKIFIKFMKKPCEMTGGDMAIKHTQAEWQEINDQGMLNDELLKVCPAAEPLKEAYIEHVYDFLYYYASDSGNVPAC